MITEIRFIVQGIPKGQPRPRAFKNRAGQVRVYDPGTAEGWKSAIAVAAREYCPAQPLTVPLRVELRFGMPRPNGHYGTGRNSGKLRASAPRWHQNVPDVDNMAKAVLDALTTIGMWGDDKQIQKLVIEKGWAPGAAHSGMSVYIAELETTDAD